MEPSSKLNNLKLALRNRLCQECEQRQAGDDAPAPEAARCESDCTLFVNLPRLARVAEEGEPPCGYEVFTKSLQPFLDNERAPDIVQALTIIEAAGSEASQEKIEPPKVTKT